MLTATDLKYIRDLIEAEDAFDAESRHLEQDSPAGILERLAELGGR